MNAQKSVDAIDKAIGRCYYYHLRGETFLYSQHVFNAVNFGIIFIYICIFFTLVYHNLFMRGIEL